VFSTQLGTAAVPEHVLTEFSTTVPSGTQGAPGKVDAAAMFAVDAETAGAASCCAIEGVSVGVLLRVIIGNTCEIVPARPERSLRSTASLPAAPTDASHRGQSRPPVGRL
jgi:hypothetical protein